MIKNKRFDEERALYGSNNVSVVNCKFTGPKDGESALKESKNIKVKDSYFNLRYPFLLQGRTSRIILLSKS